MPDFVTKQGDTAVVFEDTLKYDNGEAVNLEGATVRFQMRAPTATEAVTLGGTTSVTAAKEGKVRFTPVEADVATVGNYMGAWKVTFESGQTMTFPTEGWLWVQVQPNLTAKGNTLLVGVPEVKDRLYAQSPERAHDEMLQEDIEAVAPLIENLTGPIIPRKYDEWYEGGHATISLRHRPSYGFGSSPIFQLLAVSEYRGPIEYDLALVPTPTQGSVYSAMGHGELGTIVRRTSGGGTYPFWSDPNHPQQSVHVVYYVGQETVPAIVKRAAVETIRWWHETTQDVGKGSLTLGDMETPERPRTALPYHVIAMLTPMRRAPAIA